VGDLPRRFHYIAVHLDTVADNARDIDFAMRWGFGWNVGPFETWQASGWTGGPVGQGRHRRRPRTVQRTAASLGIRRSGR
jgi:hypothetical protein